MQPLYPTYDSYIALYVLLKGSSIDPPKSNVPESPTLNPQPSKHMEATALATGGTDGVARLFDPRTGNCLVLCQVKFEGSGI